MDDLCGQIGLDSLGAVEIYRYVLGDAVGRAVDATFKQLQSSNSSAVTDYLCRENLRQGADEPVRRHAHGPRRFVSRSH